MSLLEFSRLFDRSKGEVLLSQHEVARPNNYNDFFFSFCIFGGELYSLNCRYPIIPYYRIGTAEFHDERVYLRRYASTPNGLDVVEQIEIGRGGDPRVVSNGKDAYAIIIHVDRSKLPIRDVGALLYDLRKRRTLTIKCAAPNFFYGKNWQPYMVGDELYVVHEVTPFRVLKIDVDSGQANIIEEIDISFKLSCFHTKYPMFRGGSNCLYDKGRLYGVGRATSQRYRHHPFFWSFERDAGLEILFSEFFYDFHKRGYNIIDPTSLFSHEGDIYFGLCCSERDWAHKQLVSHFLIRFPQGGLSGENERLTDFFARSPVVETMGTPILDRHMFFCVEMPSAVANVHEFGGRVSTGVGGHLVHGPYIRIESEGLYCAELSYLTKPDPQKRRAGVFDVTVSGAGGSKQEGFRTLGEVELSQTDGEMVEARIEFDTAGLVGASLEFRVYTDTGVALNAFHIRTWRKDLPSAARYWIS